MNTYSFLDVYAALTGPGGVVSLGSGAGNSEEGISIEPAAEVNTTMIGADGSGQHSLSADRSGRITVRLLRTSPTNQLLMTLFNFQTASAANHGQNTITITDKARGDVITCQQVAFVKAPSVNYGREAGMLEWEFSAIRIDRALGS